MNDGSPSFEAIFNASAGPNNQYGFSSDETYDGQGMLTEEPPSLHRRSSQASIGSRSGRRQSSGSYTGLNGGSGSGSRDSDGLRKDSFPPFQSTLINTASQDGRMGLMDGQRQHGNTLSQGQNVHYAHDQHSNTPLSHGQTLSHQDAHGYNYIPYQGQIPLAYGQDQNYQLFGPGTPGYADGSVHSHSTPSYSGTGGQYQLDASGSGNGNGNGNGNYATYVDPGTATTDAFSIDHSPYTGYATGGEWNQQQASLGEDELIAELVRTISGQSSRAPSPLLDQYQGNLSEYQPSPLPDQYQSFTPNAESRSSSPYPGPHAQFPAFRPGSAHGSPFNKPQSPPALVIPNASANAPSPLPPIVTQPAAQQNTSNGQGHALANQTGMGGLLPPTNPQLEHLSGMMGISPIGPNADGPQIFVQPSTPISGLKDGRGHFDAALRKAGMGGQSSQGAQGQHVQEQIDHSLTYNVPPPNPPSGRGSSPNHPLDMAAQLQAANASWGVGDFGMGRPRAKSESNMPEMDRHGQFFDLTQDPLVGDWRNNVGTWLNEVSGDTSGPTTVNPNQLPGNDVHADMVRRHVEQQHQLAQLQAHQRHKLSLDTGVLKYEPGEFSPTSLAFYQQRGLFPSAASAPYDQTQFAPIAIPSLPHTAAPNAHGFLGAPGAPDMSRRRSFAEGSAHPAAGAGTPGYGVFASPFGTLDPGRLRGVGGAGNGHRRAARSEDFGRTGWGMGAGGSTTDFLNSITAGDGLLIPPRGRSHSHSRQSSASSVRSASPALSISSQGSSNHRMEMPEGVMLPGDGRLAKMKVTSMATEVAATMRRTNDGVFQCPIPGCGSTFTRHFNLKGHLRSHNDERPYKCLYDGCPKSEIGFARQHDCKRHMLLHKGLRPFECDGCGKKFARLDALTRHHKSEQGQECAITHPLPVNPDGTPMSENQYKAFKAAQERLMPQPIEDKGGAGKRGRRKSNASDTSRSGVSSKGSIGSRGSRGGGEEDDWAGSGMEDYDRV